MPAVYQELARKLGAYQWCVKEGNACAVKHLHDIEATVEEYMPSGSGVDTGTTLNLEKSTPDRLVFDASYHVMNEAGFYVGWIDFQVIVKPSLAFDFDLSIRGQFGKYQDIKEYLYNLYSDALGQEVQKQKAM